MVVVSHEGTVVNSVSLLPHRDLKKMKEMPTEKACEGKTKGSSHLCSHGNRSIALGWVEGQTHCLMCNAAFDLQENPETEKPMR